MTHTENKTKHCGTCCFAQSANLSARRNMTQEEKRLTGLEEEIIRFNMVNRPINHSELGLKQWGEMVARHFYELGKQSGSSEIPNDMEEAAEEYAKLDEEGKWKDGGKYKGFIAGAKWDRSQMLKEAVEGHIVSKNDGWNSIELPSTLVCDAVVTKLADRVWITPCDEKQFNKDVYDNFKAGDRVRIIVIKSD